MYHVYLFLHQIKCNRIFVLDCGDNWDEKVCPPKLLIFDLKDNKLVDRIPLPSDMFNDDSLFVTPLAYVRDCRHITDATVSSIFSPYVSQSQRLQLFVLYSCKYASHTSCDLIRNTTINYTN